jgi:hypothetical protein
MRIQNGFLVSLGYGKYVRSDRVESVVPIEEDRGPGRRTFVFVEGQKEPLVASRGEDSLVRDLVREPKEVSKARQQQEVLRDLLDDLKSVPNVVRDIVRDQSSLGLEHHRAPCARRARRQRVESGQSKSRKYLYSTCGSCFVRV